MDESEKEPAEDTSKAEDFESKEKKDATNESIKVEGIIQSAMRVLKL